MSEIVLPDILDLEPSESKKLSLIKFTQHLDTILSGIKDVQICNLSSKFISDYYITIDFMTFKYTVPINLHEQLDKCKLKREIRFYIIPLILKFSEDNSHANVLIVDNLHKTIELYEPHGKQFSPGKNVFLFNIELHIKNLIKIILDRRINFIFKNVHYACPIGFQARQSKINYESGHCVAWTLFFINIRLINLFKSSEEIIHYLNVSLSDTEIDLLIRKYITLIENETLLENKKYINEYYDIKLSEHEESNIKKNIKEKINTYLKHQDFNINKYGGVNYFTDIQKLFNEFIIYSKFNFFHELYFKTLENFKLQKTLENK